KVRIDSLETEKLNLESRSGGINEKPEAENQRLKEILVVAKIRMEYLNAEKVTLEQERMLPETLHYKPANFHIPPPRSIFEPTQDADHRSMVRPRHGDYRSISDPNYTLLRSITVPTHRGYGAPPPSIFSQAMPSQPLHPSPPSPPPLPRKPGIKGLNWRRL
ncbi:hypothetical protein PMAYCL1PPCAC_25917, partial [Pristionchus mayeri]